MEKRKSIRRYKGEMIPEKELEKILEAGRLAPSARNGQNWKFVVVSDPETRREVASAANNQMFLAGAPVIICVCATEPGRKMSCGQYAHTVDCSIAMTHMILQAAELGIGSCWIGAFDQEKVKNIIRLPDPMEIVALSPFGYPDEDPAPRPRKSRDEVISHNQYTM